MKFRSALLKFGISLFVLPSSSWAALTPARVFLLRGQTSEAIAAYSKNRLTRDPQKAAEFAYALAVAGFKDLALGHLDQAYSLQGSEVGRSGSVNFYASEVFRLIGEPDVSAELALQAERPGWIPANFVPSAIPVTERARGPAEGRSSLANRLMVEKRFYTAADRFQQILRDDPANPTVYAGYAIALEKIGAYRKSAWAVSRSIELRGSRMLPDQKEIYEAHRAELEARPQEPPKKSWVKATNRSLKGRYLAFLGGYINRSKTNTVSNINGRLGKFFTNRFDASLTAGYTGGNLPDDYRGSSYGLAARYHQPLPTSLPINATFGSRVDYNPRPSDNTSIVISPGLSWVTAGGSIDLNYDYGVSGPLEKTSTLSLGYTAYFGGRK